MQIAPVPAHGDYLTAARAGDGGDVDAFFIVNIDHCGAVFGQDAGEKRGLCGEIGLECFVIIKVVLGEVGEPRRLERHPVQTALVKPVA